MKNQKNNARESIAFSILCIGLDNSGKTTICRKISNSWKSEILPTAYMEIHYVKLQKYSSECLIYDLSGNGRHRSDWQNFYSEVQAIFYVVDASDSENRYTLQKLLIEEILTDQYIQQNQIPMIVLLNKQDKPNTYDRDEILKDLGLDVKRIHNKVIVKETSGVNGQGLNEALDIVADIILTKK